MRKTDFAVKSNFGLLVFLYFFLQQTGKKGNKPPQMRIEKNL